MEEGLFQLIFILLIFVAAILDFLARQRNKRKRMEGMETEEEAELDTPWGEPWEAEGGRDPEGQVPAGEGTGERRTADTMVPADLWEEILGGPGMQRSPAQQREEERAAEDQVPPPTPPPRVEERPAARSGPEAMPGPRTRWEQRQEPTPSRPSSARAPSTQAEPTLPSEKELMERAKAEERKARSERARARKPQRAKAEVEVRDRWADLFRAGDRDALRRAIVYREVLGKPLSLREGSGGWEEEPR